MSLDNTARLPTPAPDEYAGDLRKTNIAPDFWYPIARARDLKAGKLLAAGFAGSPIVLARTKSGELLALEDRCAHRQVPLHVGVVAGNAIRCGYHGWEYNAQGKCVSVPYLDRCRLKPNNVRHFPVREAYGLLFVFPGDAARAEATPFPYIPSASDPAYKMRYLDRLIDCHYSFMHENLMDMNHQFLHRRLMGEIGRAHV